MTRLNVPFSEKDRAKALAGQAGTRLIWNPDEKAWFFPGTTVPDSLKEFLPKAPSKKGPKVLQIDYTYFPFAKEAGAKWNKDLKVCTYEGDTLPVELTGFEPLPYSWEAWAQEELTGERLHSKTKRELIPRPHQEEAITEILKAKKAGSPGFLLADDVGIGKSLSAWESVLRSEPHREKQVLILCPLGVIASWRSTIEKTGEGNNRILILNYDKLKKIYELSEGSTAKSLKGVARKGKPLEFDFVILDEAHKLKNTQSARAKLATGLYKGTKFLLWASATAGQNALELAYLAPLLASRTGSKVTTISKDFETWCQSQGIGLSRGAYGKWTQDESKETNARIHELLFSPIQGVRAGIRRRPQDIAGWPEVQRIATPFELDPQGRERYQLAWEEFLETLRSGKSQLPKNRNPLTSPTGMAGMTRFRQKASLLKVKSTFELALDLLENGRQVAISCQYLDPAKEIIQLLEKEKIPTTKFTGEETPQEKEANRIAYQKGEKKVILFTVEEGINLHSGEYNDAPRAQINHDPRWSAISAHQIDGRSHRNGTFAPVYWTYLKDTVEDRLINRLLERMTSMGEIHGDETETLDILRTELGI